MRLTESPQTTSHCEGLVRHVRGVALCLMLAANAHGSNPNNSEHTRRVYDDELNLHMLAIPQKSREALPQGVDYDNTVGYLMGAGARVIEEDGKLSPRIASEVTRAFALQGALVMDIVEDTGSSNPRERRFVVRAKERNGIFLWTYGVLVQHVPGALVDQRGVPHPKVQVNVTVLSPRFDNEGLDANTTAPTLQPAQASPEK